MDTPHTPAEPDDGADHPQPSMGDLDGLTMAEVAALLDQQAAEAEPEPPEDES